MEPANIVGPFFVVFRFQAFWDRGKPGVGDEASDGVESELAFPQVGMTVYHRTQTGSGVIEVEGEQFLLGNEAEEGLKGLFVSIGRSEVVSGFERMSGIKTDSEAIRQASGAQDLRQVFESGADAMAHAGRSFEENDGGPVFGTFEGVVEAVGDRSDCFGQGSLAGGTGVDDEIRDREGFASSEFGDEGMKRFFPIFALSGQVDEIDSVSNGKDSGSATSLLEWGNALFMKGGCGPLAGGCRKELGDAASVSVCFFQCPMEPSAG